MYQTIVTKVHTIYILSTISNLGDNYQHMLFHISSKFDFFIGVEIVMCHALICVKEIHQSLT